MAALGLIGFLGFIGCVIWLIVSAVKKKKKKNSLIGIGIALVLFIVGVANTPSAQTVPTSASSGTSTSAVPSEVASSAQTTSKAPASSAATSSQKSVEELRKSAKSITYKELARYPDKYKDQFIKFSGKVIQSVDESGSFTLRVAQNGDSDQIFLVTYLPTNDARILENDEVTVYGSYDGVRSYTSTLGAQITIPSVSTADIVIK